MSFQTKYNQTPQEFHAAHAFPKGAKCAGCSNKPQVRAIVMMSAVDAEKMGMIPKGAGKAPVLFKELAPFLVKINDGGTPKWFIRTSMAYSCRACRKDFEKALAKAPSYCVVEINEGPDYRNRVSVSVGVN